MLPDDNEQEKSQFVQILAQAGLFKSMPNQAMGLLKSACHAKDLNLVETLFATIDPSTTDAEGNTSLHIICQWAPAEIASKVKCHPHMSGGDLNAQNNSGQTPLMIAADTSHRELVEFLLGRSASINAVDKDGNTALSYAVKLYSHEIVQLLLGYGANTEIANSNQQTPLIIAVKSENENAVKLLLDKGANINAVDKEGKTSLHHAILNRKRDIVQVLLDLGANTEVTDSDRRTPLLIAAGNGPREIVELLLDKGADVQAFSQSGITALSGALLQPSIFDAPLIERLRSKDKGLTQWIHLNKELGHRFGIKGISAYREQQFRLTGWNRRLAVSALQSTAHLFYQKLLAGIGRSSSSATTGPDDLYENIKRSLKPDTLKELDSLGEDAIKNILEATEEAIATSVPDDITVFEERLRQGKPVGVATGWSGHALTFAIVKNPDGSYTVARCNKGGGKVRPGILINQARKVDFWPIYPNVTKEFINSTIETAFEFSESAERYIQQTPQKIGNCAVANTNSMELALLVLQLEPLLGYDAGVEVAQAIKKARCKDSRVATLRAYLDFHDQTIFPINVQLIQKIIDKLLRLPDEGDAVKTMIAAWF